nr:hypothetical protein BaRGS_033476 [Batillaria attramentaria]
MTKMTETMMLSTIMTEEPDDISVTPVEDIEVIVEADPMAVDGASDDDDEDDNTDCADTALEVCVERDGTLRTSVLVDAVCIPGFESCVDKAALMMAEVLQELVVVVVVVNVAAVAVVAGSAGWDRPTSGDWVMGSGLM